MALIQNGNLLSIDQPSKIIQKFGKPLIAARSDNMLLLLNDLKNYEEVEDAYPFGAYHHVVLKNNFDETKLKKYLEKLDRQNLEILKVEPDIEDCFIALMKN